ncbi:MAG TPA: hypothetical protein VE783_02140 [Candidatus Limnocylindrales bacterium]|jgi:hypothetical protein|nr:hypothetical protein [Candidatus Limnocylindrales bacterium]
MAKGQLPSHMGKGFLLTELRTGITFANVALTAPKYDPGKLSRNRKNARKAYDTFCKFRDRVALSTSDLAELEEIATQLRSALQQLGENIIES